jgi:hypothetical protein
MERGEGIAACAVGKVRWMRIDFYKSKIRDASKWDSVHYVVFKALD